MPKAASPYFVALPLLLAACTGQILPASESHSRAEDVGTGDGTHSVDETDTAPLDCDSPAPGRSPLRRLNRAEYITTASDLLHLSTAEELAGSLPPDEQSGGFSNNADALVVTGLLAGAYVDVSEALATAAMAAADKPITCTSDESETACAERFIDTFGKRAFRRPVRGDEHARYAALYTAARKSAPFEESIAVLIRAFLQSPHFLYRVEAGEKPEANASVVAVTPYELATRLSYALWGTMPSDDLFAAADQGKLDSESGVEAEVRLMLQDPRAHQSVARFHGEWLGTAGVLGASKDPTLFPDTLWNPTLQSDLRAEVETFVDQVFWNDGKLETLLSAPYSFLNQNLAAFYGVAAASGSGFVKTDLDPSQRAGILTSGALMALLASNNQTSPVHRGKFVREKILCEALSPPPPNLMIVVPKPDLNSSTRERFSQHSKDPACAGCHSLMDPIGFGFENYDATGRFRTTDAGFPVDASGEVIGTSDADGEFVGAVELAQRLSVSEEARSCVVMQVFRYTTGRSETDADACTLAALGKHFSDSAFDMREIWVAAATSDAFRFRSVTGGGE